LEGLHHLLQLAGPRHRGDGISGGRPGALFSGKYGPETIIAKPTGKHFMLEVDGSRAEHLGLVCKRTAEGGHAFQMSFRGTTDDPREERVGFDEPSQVQQLFFGHVAKAGLGSVVKLQLGARALAADHYSDDQSARIEHDGTGLASALQRIQIARDGRLESIEQEVRSVVPAVRRLRTQQVPIVRVDQIPVTVGDETYLHDQQRTYLGAGIEIEWGDVGWIPARHVSEGTLLVLGLITMLHDRPPALVLIDDIDKALHPTAQREVVKLLKRVLERNPALQIVATAHSPFVVDELEPEEVLVVGAIDEHTSDVRKLSEHPSWGRQRDYLHAGEFWSAVGESWVREKKA
jgi:hypothetical protein